MSRRDKYSSWLGVHRSRRRRSRRRRRAFIPGAGAAVIGAQRGRRCVVVAVVDVVIGAAGVVVVIIISIPGYSAKAFDGDAFRRARGAAVVVAVVERAFATFTCASLRAFTSDSARRKWRMRVERIVTRARGRRTTHDHGYR